MMKKIAVLIGLAAATDSVAVACLFVAPDEYVLDETEIAEDVEMPDSIVDPVVTHINRGVGPQCEGEVCSSTSCDSTGTMRAAWSATLDDRTPAEHMGYRAVLVDGEPPEGLYIPEGAFRSEDGLFLFWHDEGTEYQEAFGFTIGLISVDLAGNEGEMTTLWIADSGRETSEARGCSVVGGGGLLVGLLAGLVVLRRRRT